MTDTPKDGGPAMATHPPGMSLRDYFAGQAMQAVLNSFDVGNPYDREGLAVFARRAYALADAMLAEREKGTK